MSDTDIEGLLGARDVLRYALYVRYHGRCSSRSCVFVSFGSSSRSVSVSSNEVFVVVVLAENTVEVLVLVG